MNAFARISPKGVETRPPSFFLWHLQWGLSVFQWGSNPHNPPPIFTLHSVARREVALDVSFSLC